VRRPASLTREADFCFLQAEFFRVRALESLLVGRDFAGVVYTHASSSSLRVEEDSSSARTQVEEDSSTRSTAAASASDEQTEVANSATDTRANSETGTDTRYAQRETKTERASDRARLGGAEGGRASLPPHPPPPPEHDTPPPERAPPPAFADASLDPDAFTVTVGGIVGIC
jgi:hypothetical protein